MRTLIWVALLVLLVAVVVLQALPSIGTPRTLGRNPDLIAKAVVIGLVVVTVVVSVGRLARGLFQGTG